MSVSDAVRWAVYGLEAVGCGLALAAVVMVAGPWIWAADVLTSFVVQVAALALLVAIPTALLKRPVGAGASVVALLAAGWVLRAPLSAPAVQPVDGTDVSVFFANVLRVNPTPDALRAQLDRADPDVVVLVEPNQAWLDQVGPWLPLHTHRLKHPQDDNFGMAVFSKLPLEDVSLDFLGPQPGRPVPTITARVVLPQGSFHLIAAHPFPPVGASSAASRNGWFDAVAPMSGPDTLLIGDLNAGPGSPHLQGFLDDAKLRSARGIGGGTWPSHWPAPLRVPIDHALVGSELGVGQVSIGEPFGSDHLPLVVELHVPHD
jgi:endonuclease/exonuclease/phosphatase (EEP) superfamily protein YafD